MSTLLWADTSPIPHQAIKGDACLDEDGRARPSILSEHGDKLVRIWNGERGRYFLAEGEGLGNFEEAKIYRLDEAWRLTRGYDPEMEIEYQPVVDAAPQDESPAETWQPPADLLHQDVVRVFRHLSELIKEAKAGCIDSDVTEKLERIETRVTAEAAKLLAQGTEILCCKLDERVSALEAECIQRRTGAVTAMPNSQASVSEADALLREAHMHLCDYGMDSSLDAPAGDFMRRIKRVLVDRSAADIPQSVRNDIAAKHPGAEIVCFHDGELYLRSLIPSEAAVACEELGGWIIITGLDGGGS